MAVESALNLEDVNPFMPILGNTTTTALHTRIIYHDHIDKALVQRRLESDQKEELQRLQAQASLKRYLFLSLLPKSSSTILTE